MIKVVFNNEVATLESDYSLSHLLGSRGYENGCFAVARNSQFIPRSQYPYAMLAEGDVVDIITPMQGG